MSEIAKGDDVALESTDDVSNQETSPKASDAGKDQSVKYETYDRVIKKLKTREQEFDQLQERLKRLEQQKLEAEGNKDELIASLKQEIGEHKNRYRTAIGSVALSQGKSAIVDVAVKAGCNSPEILTKLLESELQDLEYDDEFKPNRDQIAMLVEDARKKNPILFSKDAPKTANHNLNPNVQTQKSKKPIHKMTDEELDSLWANARNNPGQRA